MKAFTIKSIGLDIEALKQGTSPRAIFTVDAGKGEELVINRPLSLLLIDLHKAFEASNIKAKAFDNPKAYKAMDIANLKQALKKFRKGTLEGDISVVKAGDPYTVTAKSQAMTNPKHPMFGKIKVGDTLPREKDGIEIKGFLELFESDRELDSRNYGLSKATLEMEMYDMSLGMSLTEDIEEDIVDELADELTEAEMEAMKSSKENTI